ncbi:RNA 2',3'-cyclic phosphodiesterase [Marininema halotolerans]|uniref:RNA 2',3'-cyclic phosphodiesterase n=1 Tax=Marininema halotolerans TaxID=1155944 RepID=A0A1I6SME4_9BACL|nr:RNA 2',3'-cyclic phosphodiesterase [Marininema halotolerans]SFS78099.1 2'-5' RNA ligase [Marininema halotolerans]
MSSNPLYRLFIAIPLPDHQRVTLSHWSASMQKQLPFQRWVHPSDYHITLQFLGACTFKQARKVKRELKQIVAKEDPFQLQVRDFGFFGVPTHPRILWAGLGGDLHRLQSLYHTVAEKVEPLGFTKEKRRYQPHITLAKKYGRNDFPHDRLAEFPPLHGELSWTVDEMILYQTHLYRSPMYSPMAQFGLG